MYTYTVYLVGCQQGGGPYPYPCNLINRRRGFHNPTHGWEEPPPGVWAWAKFPGAYITSGHHLSGRLASGLRQESSGRRLNSNWLCHLFGRTANSSSLTSSLPDGSVPGTNVVPGWADWPWLPTPAPHFRGIYTLTACSLSYHHGPWWVPNTTKAQVFGVVHKPTTSKAC